VKVRDAIALVVGAVREFADQVEMVGAFIEHVDKATCSECRFPLKGEQPCAEGACGDCCARAHAKCRVRQ